MQVRDMEIGALRPYQGNPRNNDAAVDAVCASIETFGFKAPLIIDKENVIICGHTRHKAAVKLGLATVPCVVADDLTAEQVKAFRLIDNKTSELATWDIGALAVEIGELQAAGVDNLEDYGFDTSDEWWRRAAWKQAEKYCNLRLRIKANLHGDYRSLSFFESNRRGDGENIARIKENPAHAKTFAACFVDFLNKALGENLAGGDWAILTTPRRRHREGFHFASEICRLTAETLGLKFYEDAFDAKNRTRIAPEFTLEIKPRERNILLLDDIVSTGETLRTCRKLLLDAGFTVFCIAAIRNSN